MFRRTTNRRWAVGAVLLSHTGSAVGWVPRVPILESATDEDLQGWIHRWERVPLHRFDEDVETTTGRGEAFIELAKTFERHQPAEVEQKTVSYVYEGGAGVGKTRLMLAYPPKEKDGQKGNNTERDTMLYLGFNCRMPLTEDEGRVTAFYAEAVLARRLLAMLYVPRKTKGDCRMLPSAADLFKGVPLVQAGWYLERIGLASKRTSLGLIISILGASQPSNESTVCKDSDVE